MVPDSCHSPPKTLGIFWAYEQEVSLLLFISPLKPYQDYEWSNSGGFEVITRDNNHGIGGLELSALLLHQQGEGCETLRLITNGQWFSQPCLHNEASIKHLNLRIWRATRLVSTWVYREGRRPWEVLEALYLPHVPPMSLFIWVFSCVLCNILYKGLENRSKCFPESWTSAVTQAVACLPSKGEALSSSPSTTTKKKKKVFLSLMSHYSKLSYLKRGLWVIMICSLLFKRTGNNLILAMDVWSGGYFIGLNR
jgi:hypothetical protein